MTSIYNKFLCNFAFMNILWVFSAMQDYWNFQNLLNLMKNLLIKIIFTIAGRINTWFEHDAVATLFDEFEYIAFSSLRFSV